MREAKERIIYDNYDLDEMYDDVAGYIKDLEDEDYSPSDDEVWREIYAQDELNWDEEKFRMENFFSTGTYILTGTVGRWCGRVAGGFVFQGFDEMWNKHNIAKDCDNVRFYDENGHFFIKCCHHDGTNYYEVRKLTEKGIDMYERWNDNWDDPRSEREIHETLFNDSHYSVLPHYAHKIFGVPKQEWVKKVA